MSTSGSREAAFIGKITASAMHEIRNVSAIVKKSAGLIDDLIRMAAEMTTTLNDVAVSAPGTGADWDRTQDLVQELGAAL